MSRRAVLILCLLALAACKKPRARAAPDASPDVLLTPGGYVNSPAAVKREVEKTLEKEHEKTLAPIVE